MGKRGLVMERVTKKEVDEVLKKCVDYAHRDNSGNLRERYGIQTSETNNDIMLVEGNVNGWFVIDRASNFNETLRFLEST